MCKSVKSNELFEPINLYKYTQAYMHTYICMQLCNSEWTRKQAAAAGVTALNGIIVGCAQTKDKERLEKEWDVYQKALARTYRHVGIKYERTKQQLLLEVEVYGEVLTSKKKKHKNQVSGKSGIILVEGGEMCMDSFQAPKCGTQKKRK